MKKLLALLLLWPSLTFAAGGIYCDASSNCTLTPSSLPAVTTIPSGTHTLAQTDSPTFTGTVSAAALTLSSTLTTNVTGGGTQCATVSNTGVLSGTGAACAAGTVSSIATTSPITGGTITTTGTIACATCVTSAASLTSGAIVIGGGSQASSVDASATLSIGALSLGASGTAGSVKMGNASTGTITLQPVTGALGTVTVSLPAATDTLMGKATIDTMTNKTFDTAGTGNVFDINGNGITAVTGTGGTAVLSAGPSITGTLTGATSTWSAAVGIGTTDMQSAGLYNYGKNAVSGPVTTLTISTATFTPTFNTSNDFLITLVHASCPCTIANPSGTITPGQKGILYVVQSSTGSDTVGTWGSEYLIAGGTAAITLSTAANAIDVFSYVNKDATHIILSGPLLAVAH